jgi:threonine dehydrogenase-like Zn-dependent dehydrogenase
MLALTCHGSHDVRVDTVPDPIFQEQDDVILKVAATAICGSDLHLYRGKLPGLEDGDILGHEFMGIVTDAGPEVIRFRKNTRKTLACWICP